MAEEVFENGHCFICGRPAVVGEEQQIKWCRCQRCGAYKFDSAEFALQAPDNEMLAKLSGWIQRQNRFGIDPLIGILDFQRVSEMRIPGLRERSRLLLNIIHDQIGSPRAFFTAHAVAASDPDWLGVTYSKGDDDIDILLRILAEENLLRFSNGAWALSIMGILEVEGSRRSGDDLSQGFVAMSFSDELTTAWTVGFDPAIREAGFLPMRIDGKEYLGGISDEIIAEIRASSFVVADYTEQRNGVYFEAGFALGLGLRVIPTVRADEVSNLHFDIKHLNTITWETPNDLQQKLSKRILAVIGKGPVLAE